MLWQNRLGFVATDMAVNPAGDVFVMPTSRISDASIYVAKLGANGTGLAWTAPVGFLAAAGTAPYLAADPDGRAYVAGIQTYNQSSLLVRLTAAGDAVDYVAQLPAGNVTALAVDRSDAAFVAGTGFLVRVAPDGTAGYYTTAVQGMVTALAVDLSGNTEAYSAEGFLRRFDTTGAVIFSKNTISNGALALDAAGNAYVTGPSPSQNPVASSLAPCGSELLSVFAPDGSILQNTYIPGGTSGGLPLVAATSNSTVFVTASAGASFAPTEAGPFSAGATTAAALWRLSPNSSAPVLSLVCLANAASYATGTVAPGEIVSLFGSGFGPQQGVQSQASLQSPFPTQAAGVEVTFDGTPAPLLWVQDAQINAVAPWSLTPGQNTQVCVSYNNVKTNCLAWPVAQTAPGVFTVDGVYAAAVNQDGTINSANHPAPVGSIIAVWATGLGPITPTQADGTIVNLPLPTNVVLPVGAQAPTPIFEPCHPGFQTCPDPFIFFDVKYAGPAPYMVAGVSQINFQVVDYAPAGYQTGAISVTLPSTSSLGFQIHYVAGQ
jgi:uncharacterized protein (TIGR03437 family)